MFKSKVYVGEYASWGNTLFNAVAEAANMTSLECNGDVVKMASYAPLLANRNPTSWNPELIYLNNTTVTPTINYYMQQLFSQNAGDVYYSDVISFPSPSNGDTTLGTSCVKDSKTDNLILKIVNASLVTVQARTNTSSFKLTHSASLSLLTDDRDAKNYVDHSNNIQPKSSTISMKTGWSYDTTHRLTQ